jgi:two-component system sensor histidine kinase KdpD
VRRRRRVATCKARKLAYCFGARASLNIGFVRRESQRPEDFLELLERSRRGKLKVYLGFAAGVGKTFRMLEEAHVLRRRGVDVVLAYIEPHDRPETLALIDGLEVVPRKKIEFHGVAIEEMDLHRVLERKPTLAIVDELAHTNAPGLEHEKRYEDVAEILDAGINVMTALNIQHVESLNDLIRRATGVAVRETVPDAFIAQADQVVNVDVPVDDLLERLKAGKVYKAEKVEQALQSFFKTDNLENLREIALRELAEDVARKRERKTITQAVKRSESNPAAPTAERVLVCMASNSPYAKELLRRGSRLAGRLNMRWYVVYVETPSENPVTIDSEVQRRLLENLELARSLGAEVQKLEGADVVSTILDFAGSHSVQHIVVGRSLRPRWRELLSGSFIDQLVRHADGIDIHVVTFPGTP